LSGYLTFDLVIIPIHATTPIKAVFKLVPNPGKPGLLGMLAKQTWRGTHFLDSRVFDVEVMVLLAHAFLLSVVVITYLS
jgi:hypothetical protein